MAFVVCGEPAEGDQEGVVEAGAVSRLGFLEDALGERRERLRRRWDR